MERDDGNLYVLEAVMLALILLGAAYAVQGLQGSSVSEVRPRAELSRLVDDGLTVLAGLQSENGTLLDLYLAEAMHCAYDPTPSADDCDHRRSQNLSIKLESYLPLGAGYAIGLGNGGAVREIYRSPAPRGEAVASSYSFAPDWNLTFMHTEMSCYEAATALSLTLIPISRGATSWAREANVTLAGVETPGERAHPASRHAWNVTIAGATRPAEGTIVANVTGNATFPGSTRYSECAHGGASVTAALRQALHDTVFEASAASVPVTSSLTFETDLSALLAVSGLVVQDAAVTLYEPIPPRADLPDSWIQADTLPLLGGAVREATWWPAETALYGAHPALLRVGVRLGGVEIELRKAIVVDVALPTGEVPIDPPYRTTVQAWLPDWG